MKGEANAAGEERREMEHMQDANKEYQLVFALHKTKWCRHRKHRKDAFKLK